MRRVAAFVGAVVLGCGVLGASARADGIVPVEGPWHATTSAGLPVAFEVTGGQVTNVRFRFRWGFCGTYAGNGGLPVTVEPSGHWKAEDGSGPYVEGTFVAPDRAEGTVVAPGRMTPGCPMTHATFTAEPGAAPFDEPEAVVLAVVGKHRYVHAPRNMVIKRDGSLRFEDLRWRDWGSEVTRASGRAYVERGDVVRRPRVSVTLEELVEGGARKVYLVLKYALHGRVPAGFRHSGERLMEEYA
ncbi:MAG: hypothetical protein JST08_00970 [Actinobacteria bacterium]|nr:hypothetical protein [Actinomycetota bacterium]